MADIDYSKYGAPENKSGEIDYSKYGAAPETEEAPEDTSNNFLGLPRPKADFFQPKPEDINQMISAAAPGGRIIKPVLQAARAIPAVENALRGISGKLGKSPLMNKLMEILGTGTEGAAIGAASNPEHPVRGAVTGFGLGAGGHAVGEGIGAVKPYYQQAKNIWNDAGQVPVVHELPPVPEFSPMQQVPVPTLPEMGQLPEAQLPTRPQLPQLKLPEAGVNASALEEHIPNAPSAADDLLEKLGQGATNKEEGATKLATMIREKHDQRAAEAGQFFDHPLQVAGNEKLYKSPNPLISTAMDKEKAMLGNLKGLNVGKLYENFERSPTINNAHLLKSELGSAIGDLQQNTAKTADDRETIKRINGVRNKLENDIADAFERHDKNSNDNLAPMYQKGVNLYRENVAPYLSSPEIREITRNRVQTPKNIENIFHTPTNFEKEGKTQIGSINKIMSDLPPEAKDLVLFNKVGASKNYGNHEKLLNDLNNAKNEGYSSYFNPHVHQAMKDISEKEKSDVLNKEGVEARNKETIKQKEQEYKNSVSESKAEHARKTAEIKNAHIMATQNAILHHKNLVRDIQNLHRVNVKNALLEHKANVSNATEQHRLAVTKRKLEHKVATDKVKQQNAMNEKKAADARYKRNVMVGTGIGLGTLLLGGTQYTANKINSLRNALGSE